jgi:hypothetical protein
MSEANGPTEVFRAYLAPLAVEPGLARISERWAAIESWAEDATVDQIPGLVSAMRGDLGHAVRESLASLFAAFTKEDETFNTLGQEEMVRILATAALDTLFAHNTSLEVPAALAVLTSTWAARKPRELKLDIADRAQKKLDDIATLARRRANLNVATKLAASAAAVPANAIAKLSESVDHVTVAGAIEETIKSINRALSAQTNNIREALRAVINRVEQSDEESNVLWYLFGGFSVDGEERFDKLDVRSAAFYAAREIAEITTKPLRLDAASELLSRAGANGTATSFVDAVETIPPPWIERHVPNDLDPPLYPIHWALHRHASIGESGTWVPSWANATGIAANLEVDPNELAVAFYRERLLLRELR